MYVTAVCDGIFQVHQVREELQEPLASLVLLDILDHLDHLDDAAIQARRVWQDCQEDVVLQDLQDLQVAQVCSCHSICVSAVSDRMFHFNYILDKIHRRKKLLYVFVTSPPQSQLGRVCGYPSWQRMHSSTACASSAMSTADKSSYSAADTLYPYYTVFHKIGTPLYFLNIFFKC